MNRRSAVPRELGGTVITLLKRAKGRRGTGRYAKASAKAVHADLAVRSTGAVSQARKFPASRITHIVVAPCTHGPNERTQRKPETLNVRPVYAVMTLAGTK